VASELQDLGGLPDGIVQAHIQGVRLFTRDFSELNLLIQGEESSDRMILWATQDFLSDFNGTPPFTGHTLQTIAGYNLQSFAVRGTLVSLLQSLMIIHARNNLSFSDGGMSISINDKAPMIQSMLALFQSAYEQNKRAIKTTMNIEGMLFDSGASGLHSDYYILSATGVF